VIFGNGHARVNILKKIKIEGRWALQSIPKKANGNWDWSAVLNGRYFIEWLRTDSVDGSRPAQPLRRRRRRIGASGISWQASRLAWWSHHNSLFRCRVTETLKKPNHSPEVE
jgi:hypothetical protein